MSVAAAVADVTHYRARATRALCDAIDVLPPPLSRIISAYAEPRVAFASYHERAHAMPVPPARAARNPWDQQHDDATRTGIDTNINPRARANANGRDADHHRGVECLWVLNPRDTLLRVQHGMAWLNWTIQTAAAAAASADTSDVNTVRAAAPTQPADCKPAASAAAAAAPAARPVVPAAGAAADGDNSSSFTLRIDDIRAPQAFTDDRYAIGDGNWNHITLCLVPASATLQPVDGVTPPARQSSPATFESTLCQLSQWAAHQALCGRIDATTLSFDCCGSIMRGDSNGAHTEQRARGTDVPWPSPLLPPTPHTIALAKAQAARELANEADVPAVASITAAATDTAAHLPAPAPPVPFEFDPSCGTQASGLAMPRVLHERSLHRSQQQRLTSAMLSPHGLWHRASVSAAAATSADPGGPAIVAGAPVHIGGMRAASDRSAHEDCCDAYDLWMSGRCGFGTTHVTHTSCASRAPEAVPATSHAGEPDTPLFKLRHSGTRVRLALEPISMTSASEPVSAGAAVTAAGAAAASDAIPSGKRLALYVNDCLATALRIDVLTHGAAAAVDARFARALNGRDDNGSGLDTLVDEQDPARRVWRVKPDTTYRVAVLMTADAPYVDHHQRVKGHPQRIALSLVDA